MSYQTGAEIEGPVLEENPNFSPQIVLWITLEKSSGRTDFIEDSPFDTIIPQLWRGRQSELWWGESEPWRERATEREFDEAVTLVARNWRKFDEVGPNWFHSLMGDFVDSIQQELYSRKWISEIVSCPYDINGVFLVRTTRGVTGRERLIHPAVEFQSYPLLQNIDEETVVGGSLADQFPVSVDIDDPTTHFLRNKSYPSETFDGNRIHFFIEYEDIDIPIKLLPSPPAYSKPETYGAVIVQGPNDHARRHILSHRSDVSTFMVENAIPRQSRGAFFLFEDLRHWAVDLEAGVDWMRRIEAFNDWRQQFSSITQEDVIPLAKASFMINMKDFALTCGIGSEQCQALFDKHSITLPTYEI